jgi:sugar-specific transcriptional regulator TrmB
LSKQRIIKALEGLGLMQVDAQIYIFLAKDGPHTLQEIMDAVNLQESKVYRSLKDLQNMEVVKTSRDYPMKYSAVTFEDVIDLFIEVKKEQTKSMQENREELLSSWKTLLKKNSAK